MFEGIFDNKKNTEVNDTRQQKEAYVAECKKNYQDIVWDVNRFNLKAYGCDNFSKDDREAFWKEASEIKKTLNELKLFKSDRDDLWRKRQEACEHVIYRNKQANEIFKNKSDDHKNTIINKAHEARPCDVFFLPSTSVDFMKTCGKTIKEAWELLSYYKHEMTREDKDKAFNYIIETQEIVDAWWNEHNKYKAMKHEEWERKHEEWETKQTAWREKTRINISENYERLSKMEGARDRAQENIDKLEDMLSGAKGDDFTDKVSGWLSEAETKLASIERSIEQIQGWIDEGEAKLK